jgi:DNA-3-methyladenine glycosylase
VKVLDSRSFDRSAEDVAHDLIGCCLCWRKGDQTLLRIVTETEAYTGPEDLASHASKGRTERNYVMFGPPGIFYVYFVYGMHWMLNVVTGPIGSCRRVDPISGRHLWSGTAYESNWDQRKPKWQSS